MTRLRQMIAVLMIGALVTLSVPPVLASSAGSAVVASYPGLMEYAHSALASLWWLAGAQEDGAQRQPPVAPPSQQELEARVARLEMNPQGEVRLMRGQTQVMSAIPLDADDNVLHGLAVKWASDNSQVVSITEDGLVSAALPGTANLTATAGQKQEILSVTVTEALSASAGQNRGRGAKTVQSKLSASSNSTSSSESKLLAHGGKPLRASLAPMPELPVDADPLPDDETNSLYTTENAVGAPPGRTMLKAATPPAAVTGRENMGSNNFTFGVPLLNLPGRGGLDVSLALVYNSLLWNKSTTVTYDSQGNETNRKTHMSFDVDNGWPAAGFRLGYGQLEFQSNSGYTLIDPDGTRHQLTFISSGIFKTTDGTFITYNHNSRIATFPGGVQIQYGAEGTVTGGGSGKRSYPVKITDRNGNYILITYRAVNGIQVGPRIVSIRDTMQRVVRFLYAAGGDQITSITAPGYQASTPDRALVRFIYEDLPVTGTFASSISVTRPATPIKVIRYAYFRGTKGGYRFDYSPFGMINNIVQLRDMVTDVDGVVSEGDTGATTKYNFPADANPTAPLSDVPKYNQRIDSYWNNGSMVTLTPTTFTVNETLGTTTINAPDSSQTVTTILVKPDQWDNGLVSKVERKKGGVLLSKSVYFWERDASFQNPRVYRIDTTNDASPGQTKSTVVSYAAFNNVSTLYECDFNVTCTPQDAAQKALRRTETTYVEDAAWTDRGLLNLPISRKVFQGTSTSAASEVVYNYDEYTAPAGAALTARNDITGHDDTYDPYSPTYNPATDKRGNITRMTTYSNAGATNPADKGASVDKSFYDIAGNVVTAEMDCCQQKQYVYTIGYRYAYPTQVISGTSPQLDTEATYDFNTGLMLTSRDENNQTTNYSYYVETLRPSETVRPDAGYTRYTYEDSLPSFVKIVASLDTSTTTGDRTVESLRYMDGLGRETRTFGPLTTDGQTNNLRVTTDIEYDSMGRVYRVSNPYYSSGPGSAVNPSGLWTRRSYDGLGRTKTVTLPDNNTLTKTYAGDLTTTKDEAGKERRQKRDALGRLVRVDEPDDTGELGDPATPTRPTSYEYDILDNLTKVTQGGQIRSFKYDSLSRMTHEKQVEADAVLNSLGQVVASGGAWTGVYKYDTQGLLTDSYDARGIHAVYSYDGLNRLSGIDFSDTTADIAYLYDQVVGSWFNKGRLTEVQTKVNGVVKTSEKYNYTKMGQIGQHSQTIGTTYTTKYLYNLAGQLTQETYPSLRTVKYGYDNAGRLASVTDATRTYVSGLTYSAHGGMTTEVWGQDTTAQLEHSMGYNNRLQVNQIKLEVGGAETTRFDYLYGEVNATTGAVDATKNTGQLARATRYDAGIKQWQQRFSHDSLGRLTLASQYAPDNTTIDWRADYDYDRFGNRYQSSAQNTGISYNQIQMGDISQTTNRFVSGTTYDKAGNVTYDKFRGKQYQYDAKGRQWSIMNPDGTGQATATYNGVGQRVETTSGGQTMRMVYDVFGQLIASYKDGVLDRESIYRSGEEIAYIDGGLPQYLLKDHQGSARLEVGENGSVNGNYDYLPFGERIAPPAGRSPLIPPVERTETRQRYAGLYHDETSDLDHAWWRKYDSGQGRWTSPDPYNGSMTAADPQSFNRYVYVQNDPVNAVDPSGLEFSLNTNSYFIDSFGGFYYNVFGAGYEYWGQITGQDDGDPYGGSFGTQGEFVQIFNAHITITRDGHYQYISITDTLFFGVHSPGGPRGEGPGGGGGGGTQDPQDPREQRARDYKKCWDDEVAKLQQQFRPELERIMNRNATLTGVTGGGIFLLATSMQMLIAAGPVASVAVFPRLLNWKWELEDFEREKLGPAREAAKQRCREKFGNLGNLN